MNTLSIRELRREDRAQWDSLWQGYLDFYRQALARDITELTWSRLVDPNDQPYGWVAEDGARLVGFVHYHFHLSTWAAAGYCYLEDLFVDPSYRGKGAGRALIEAVYDAADRRGVTRVYWHTETDNARAQALYNKVAKLAPFVQYRREGLKT
jgi:GNAT superfamily N-acetyltransferase